MALIQNLRNKLGEIVYPITKPNAVIFNDGENLDTKIKNIGLKIYPVGSIYLSVSDTNPAVLFGGTWVTFGLGKVLVGVDTTQTEFATVEKTGGAKNVQSSGTIGGTAITVAQMPSHGHTFNGTAGTTGGQSQSHTHTINGYTATSEKAGEHNHTERIATGSSGGSSTYGVRGELTLSGNKNSNQTTTTVDAHTHKVNIPTKTTTNASQGHTHSFTPSGTVANNGSGQTHTHTFTGNSTSVLQPYITCYMWKRVS